MNLPLPQTPVQEPSLPFPMLLPPAQELPLPLPPAQELPLPLAPAPVADRCFILRPLYAHHLQVVDNWTTLKLQRGQWQGCCRSAL